MEKKKYTKQFKEEAVKLSNEPGNRVSEVARNLGVPVSVLCSWRGKAKEGNLSSLSRDEAQELKRLRAENRRLQMERDILKKATAFFVQEKP